MASFCLAAEMSKSLPTYRQWSRKERHNLTRTCRSDSVVSCFRSHETCSIKHFVKQDKENCFSKVCAEISAGIHGHRS